MPSVKIPQPSFLHRLSKSQNADASKLLEQQWVERILSFESKAVECEGLEDPSRPYTNQRRGVLFSQL